MVHTAIGYAKASAAARRRSRARPRSAPARRTSSRAPATATTNRLPVLLLPGDTFANRRQGPVLQQLQHPGYRDWTVNESLRSVSRFFDRVIRPEQLLTPLPAAMRVLLDPAETGAVTIALHQDMQGEAYAFPARFFAAAHVAVDAPAVRRPGARRRRRRSCARADARSSSRAAASGTAPPRARCAARRAARHPGRRDLGGQGHDVGRGARSAASA